MGTTAESTETERVFEYNGVTMPDPNPALGVEQVRDVLAAAYPDIATATIEQGKPRDGKQVWSFKRAIATKG